MLKTLLQVGLIMAGIGLAKSSYDNGSLSNLANEMNFQPIITALQKFSDTAQTSGLPGSQSAVDGTKTAIDTIKQLNIQKQPSQDSNQISNQSSGTINSAPHASVPHAFYKSTPEQCPGELTIDLQTGVAGCQK